MAALVWSTDGDALETKWIDARGEPVAARAGLVVAHDQRLLAWKTRRTEGEQPCAHQCGRGVVDERCPRPGIGRFAEEPPVSVEHVDLVDLQTGETTSTVSEPPGRDAERREVEPVGGLGRYLFLTDRDRFRACGEREGSEVARFYVYDLRRQQHVDILDELDLSEQKRAVRSRMAASRYPPQDSDELELTMVRPTYDAQGELALRCQLTVWAPHEQSDDKWSSHTQSEVVPCRDVPKRLEPYAEAPEPVQRYWSSRPTTTPVGWSVIHAPDPTRRELLAVFEGHGSGR